MRTAILIHGCHLQAEGWEDIAWGDPSNNNHGRISKALALQKRLNAELLYWGTGASQKDGLKEAEYAFQYAVTHAAELPEYEGFDAYEIESMLRPMSHFDLTAMNTNEEVHGALRLCEERGIENLYLVSSPTHIARCMQEALKIRAERNTSAIEVFSAASRTSFKGSTPSDVVVIEPPHRGDMLKWQTHRYAGAMFQIMRRGNDAFAKYLEEWGDLLTQNGIPVGWNPTA